MTAIVQPSDTDEAKDFDTWDTRISNPPAGSSEDEQARAAADWILNTYLVNPKFPDRQIYRGKVQAWALTDMALFGKLGTAVGAHAKFGEDTECVGYWDDSGLPEQTALVTHHIRNTTGIHANIRAVAPDTLERSLGKARRVYDKRPKE